MSARIFTSRQFQNLKTNTVLKNKILSVNGNYYTITATTNTEVYSAELTPAIGLTTLLSTDVWKAASADANGAVSRIEKFYTNISVNEVFENPTHVTRFIVEPGTTEVTRLTYWNNGSSVYYFDSIMTRDEIRNYAKTSSIRNNANLAAALDGTTSFANVVRDAYSLTSLPTLYARDPNGDTLLYTLWSDTRPSNRAIVPHVITQSNFTYTGSGVILSRTIQVENRIWRAGVSANKATYVTDNRIDSATIKLYAGTVEIDELKFNFGNSTPAFNLPSNELMQTAATKGTDTLYNAIATEIISKYQNGKQLVAFDLVDNSVALALGDTAQFCDVFGKYIKNGASFIIYSITKKISAGSLIRSCKGMEVI